MSAVYWAHYDCNGTLPRDLTFIWGGHQPEIEIDDLNPFEGEAGVRRQKTAMQSMALIAETAPMQVTSFLEWLPLSTTWLEKNLNLCP